MDRNGNFDLKEKILSKLREYRYVLLVLALGLLLLLLPRGSEGEKPDAEPQAETRVSEEVPLERRLEEILSLVDGAGEVRVLLSYEDDGERVLAGDSRYSQESDAQGSRVEMSDTTVTVPRGGGESAEVEVSYRCPVFRGAVVAARGADSAQVRLELLEAVKAATGLGAENIKIVKMADK